MAMIKGIGHAAYTVADMDATLHFYCDILGFRHAFSTKNDDGEPYIEYIQICENQFIELFYGREGENIQTSYSHLSLEVESIQEIAEHLKANNITIDRGPVRGRDRNWQCWAKDPDGNRIEFMQMSPDSPQTACRESYERLMTGD